MSQVQTIQQASAVDMVQVVSTPPAKIGEHEHVIAWSRRGEDIPAAQKYRGIVVPSSSLRLPDGATTSKFSELLQATIHDLADKCFTKWVKDKMAVIEAPAALFNLDGVLRFWAEERNKSRISSETVLAWFAGSGTRKTLAANSIAAWEKKLVQICAPAYAGLVTKGQAATMLAKIVDDDLEVPAAQFVINRLNNVLDAEDVSEAL